MRFLAIASLALCALWACSDDPQDDDPTLLMGQLDAAPPGAEASLPVGDTGHLPQREVGAPPMGDGQVMPPEDGGVEPPGDGAMPPADAQLPPVDAGEVPEGLIATIVLAQTPQVPQASAAVAISEAGELGEAPDCVAAQVDPNAPPTPPAMSFDGGEIVLGGIRGGEARFNRDAAGVYAPGGALPSQLFSNGATLTASGAGGSQFAAFQLSMPAVREVDVSRPNFLAFESRNSDLDVRWSAGQAESILITILPFEGNGEPDSGTWLFCATTDTGSYTVPGASLGQLRSGQNLVVVTRTRVVIEEVGANQALLSASTSTAVPINLN